jgi:uncharacterized protein YceK
LPVTRPIKPGLILLHPRLFSPAFHSGQAGLAMRKTQIAAFVAFATLASGCGTVANLKTGEPELYGGVQHDVQTLQTPREQPSGVGINNLPPLILFVDLPLCAVADTLTLPLAIYEWHRGDGRTDKRERAAQESGTVPTTYQPGSAD